MLEKVDFTSVEQISEYWDTLGTQDLQYHLDDDPSDTFEGRECHDVIVENHQALLAFCHQNNIDPWDHITV